MADHNWDENKKPLLEEHSKIKHEILRSYVIKYIEILCTQLINSGATKFSIYLVDGFAGGGIYENDEKGSPFILLEAVEEAESILNKGRQKEFKIEAHFFFVDKNEKNFNSLQSAIEQSRYKGNKNINLYHKSFDSVCGDIVSNIKSRHPRGGGRAIFFLDQEGYTDVSPQMVAKIINLMPNSEFIIYTAIDWFLDFIHDDEKFKKAFYSMGLADYLEYSFSDLIRIKNEGDNNWKHVIEASLGRAWQKATNARYFRPFFLEPSNRHRGYWLLHLSPHHAAHDAMTNIHWQPNIGNHMRHCGDSEQLGLYLIGHKPKDLELPVFSFNESFKNSNIEQLKKDILEKLRFKDSLKVNDLIDSHRNTKAASNNMCYETLLMLLQDGKIEIMGEKGGKKRMKEDKENGKIITNINDNDIIFMQRQGKLFI